jgi:ubiquinol-cytochrome c reductase cytochrome b subunit
MSKFMLGMFVVSFVLLGVCGVKAPDLQVEFLPFLQYRDLGQICTVIYFGYFFLMPVWTSIEKTKPVPERVRMSH